MGMGPVDTSGGETDGGYRPLAEINVTPMVDVMLVLLIIFMVAAPLMMAGVPVDLPKTQATKLSQPREPVIVSVDNAGRVFLRQEEIPADELAGRLAALHDEQADSVVYVRGDQSINYGRVMEVMGAVNAAGFTRVSLIAKAS